MTKAQDEEFQRQIKEIQQQIGLQTKLIVKQITAWRNFIYWASSYPQSVIRGLNDADIVLNKQQSSEFAFSYNPKVYPETFILLAQQSNYAWLSNIGVKCFILENDGVIVVVSSTDSYGVYISGKSFKITVSPSVYEKLRKAKLNCKQVCIGSISHKYDPSRDKLDWSINKISSTYFPVVSSFAEAKNL